MPHGLGGCMDFREIGKHLPRTKWGEGWVDKRGKRRKVWVGFWYVYVLGRDKERRRVREKVLGTVKEIGDSRPAAMAKLRQVRALVEGTLAPAPDNPTIAELWDRYCAIKSERWSKAMEGSLVSTFKTCVSFCGCLSPVVCARKRRSPSVPTISSAGDSE